MRKAIICNLMIIILLSSVTFVDATQTRKQKRKINRPVLIPSSPPPSPLQTEAQTPEPKESLSRKTVIMPLSEVQPGLTGYGLTVFQGLEPERFDFKVLGIDHEDKNDQFRIFIEISGGPGNLLSVTNLIGGMSGSPCYAKDGRLIGVIAAAITQTRTPHAFVTPIEDLINFRPLALNKKNKYLLPKNSDYANAFPISEKRPLIQAGEAYAYFVLWGDIVSSSNATVTLVDEDKMIFYSQGHSANDLWATALPFRKFNVFRSIAKLDKSEKVGMPVGPILGSVTFDGQYGQIAEIGVMPRSIPVRLTINEALPAPLNFNFFMAYSIVALGPFTQEMQGVIKNNADQYLNATMETRISINGWPEIYIIDNAEKCISAITEIISRVLNDESIPFIDGISMTVVPESEENLFKLVDAKAISSEKSGLVKLSLTIQRELDKKRFEKTMDIKVDPRYFGKSLSISDGTQLQSKILSLGTLEEIRPLLGKISRRQALYIADIDAVVDVSADKLKTKTDEEDDQATASRLNPIKQTLHNQSDLIKPKTSKDTPKTSINNWQAVDLPKTTTVIDEIDLGLKIAGAKSITVPAPAESKQETKTKKKDKK